MQGLAALIFNRYVFAFEATSALLITAALGAMVLAHRERLTKKRGQNELVVERMQRYAETGQHPGTVADAWGLRPAQRGGHPGPAARRHGVRGVGVAHPAGPRSHPGQPGPGGADPAAPCEPSIPTGRAIPTMRVGRPIRSVVTESASEEGRTTVSPDAYVILSALLFTIGVVGFMIRRNAIVAFMCVELMLNAANLLLVSFRPLHGALDGQIAAFFVMVVAAAEVVVGLAIIVAIFRTRRSASVDDANLLKF